MIAGYDEENGPELYWLDYLGSMNKVNFAAHGYGSNFTLSTLDRYYQKDMTLEEALDVLRKCVHELKVRFLINLPGFCVKVTDKNGIRKLENPFVEQKP